MLDSTDADDDVSSADPETTTRLLPPRLARGVVTTVFCGLGLIALLNILAGAKSNRSVLLAVAAMALLLTVQLFFLSDRAQRLSTAARFGLIGAQAILGFLPFLVFGQAWVGMPGFVAGAALLMLPGRWAISAFALAVVANGLIQAAIQPEALLIVYTSVSTTLTGLIVYGLFRMAQLVRELHDTRAKVAHLAVLRERLRFARDLHDLLGYSLSAVTLKSELARRLVGKNPERAFAELEEIRDISRQALADVRTLASGYRDMSLEDEARSAQSVLKAADVHVVMKIAHPEMPKPVSTVLATVLREGVTNLLQHSKAENCWVTVDAQDGQVRMTIVNDGANGGTEEPSPHGGSGIRNLTARTKALGGSLATEAGADGTFRLCAGLPLAAPAEDREPEDDCRTAEVVPLLAATTSRPRAQSG